MVACKAPLREPKVDDEDDDSVGTRLEERIRATMLAMVRARGPTKTC